MALTNTYWRVTVALHHKTEQMNKIELDIQQAKQYYSYSQFKEMVNSLYTKGLNTGPKQIDVLIESTKMSIQRMKKWDKIFKISPMIKSNLMQIQDSWTWYVITEGWCGDASQILPVIAKLAGENENIELKILLRDENPDIMRNYLTNGGMAIPILVAVNNETGESTPHFGPRPLAIQEMVQEFKANPENNPSEFSKTLHFWYAKDKGLSTQFDVMNLVNTHMIQGEESLHQVV